MRDFGKRLVQRFLFFEFTNSTDRPQLEIMPPDDDPLVFSPLVHTTPTSKVCLSQGTTGGVIFFNRKLELVI